MKKYHWLILLMACLGAQICRAQNTYDSTMVLALDSIPRVNDSTDKDKDVVDVFQKMRHKKPKLHLTKTDKKERLQFTLVPAAGYTLQTGFSVLLAANSVFYTDKDDHSKSSTILASVSYTQYNQVILPLFVNIWTKGKKFNLISDMRYMSYPSQTYGLGPSTSKSAGYDINFSYLKLHQSVLKRVSSDLFAGVGYFYDLLWSQREVNPPAGETSFQQYGLHRKEVASGFNFQVLYDNRANQVNPTGGSYATFRYRVSPTWLGSNTTWQSGVLDLRKYFAFPKGSHNTVALWNFNWMTLDGKPPYLLLPSIGWDDYFNTGRGYVQGRFRAKNMSYLEAEYRFRLVPNGLFGAVIFGNLQTYSSDIPGLYQTVIPGGGAGLRIKVNKRSNTNLCIDYGFGKDGSRGFFINLGEVF
ncbi:MAG: hypothetical protein ABIS36_14730 [Chryseolinea sp.]